MHAMVSKKELYLALLQKIISLESSISTPGTSSWLRKVCLKSMGVKLEGDIYVGEGTKFVNPGMLKIGDKVCIGEHSIIASHAPIFIGNNFLSSSGLYINSGSHHVETLEPFHASITIGNYVWCGMRVTICSGVSIGNNVVIGAGSVVTQSLPDNCVAVGVPAKPIKSINREKFEVWSLI